MDQETILILDFGGQYKQLIARRVRECRVYSEILPHTPPMEALRARAPKGIILTGGPNSVYDPASPLCSPELFALGVPVLGICYGAQLMAHVLGGRVAPAATSEYGGTDLCIDRADSPLLADVPPQTTCWMSHTDRIMAVPPGFAVTAHTPDCPIAAMEDGRESCMRCSSIPRWPIPPRAPPCSAGSSGRCAAVRGPGRWPPSWRSR